jgi:hypothetical protein
VGSRSNLDLAYIAGFLDGDGSLMFQLKKRSDTKRGWRFNCTICLYQDSRHETPLFWIKEVLGIGYVARRNDGMTELRINGFKRVQEILLVLRPYLRFKKLQVEAMLSALDILVETRQSDLTHIQLAELIDAMLVVQSQNYATNQKKTRQELYIRLGIDPVTT